MPDDALPQGLSDARGQAALSDVGIEDLPCYIERVEEGEAGPLAEWAVAPPLATREAGSWRDVAAGPVVAVVALVATNRSGVAFGDPDHVGARRLGMMCALVALLVAIDIGVRAARRSGRIVPSREALRRVRGERWTAHQAVAVVSALVGFYVTYVAYRNVKSVTPLLRPGELFDRQLVDADRTLFFGQDPSDLLHAVLGTGISTTSSRPSTSRSCSSCP